MIGESCEMKMDRYAGNRVLPVPYSSFLSKQLDIGLTFCRKTNVKILLNE